MYQGCNIAGPLRVPTDRSVIRGLLVLALVASACTGTSTPRPSPSRPPSDLGGTLRVLEPGPAAFPISLITRALNEDFDPQRSYWGTAWELFRCCLLRTLISYDLDPANRGKIVLRPDLAAAPPVVSADGLTWTFHLRSGMHYGPPLQGVSIVTADIVRALERAGDVKIAPVLSASDYFSVVRGFDEYREGKADSISGLETPDDLTLVIHVTRPAGDLPYLLALPGSAPIPPNPDAPRAPFGVATGHHRYGSFLVSSGPYMLEGSETLDFSAPPSAQVPVEGFVPGRSITLVRNPSWERASDPLRPALVDRIEVSIGGSREEAFQAVESGRADVLFESLVGVDKEIRALRSAGLQDRIHAGDDLFTAFISMNLATPPFDDIHVRKAVNYAIDKARLMTLAHRFKDTFLQPVTVVATHVVPDIMENELLLGYDPYRTHGDHGDLRRARAEMSRSRYDTDGDGICDQPACDDIVARTNPYFFGEGAGALVARNLQEIGLQVRPELLTFDEWFKLMPHPALVPALCICRGWVSDFPNPSTFFIPLFSSVGLGVFNSTLVGATSGQLRTWGYPVDHVPSLETRIAQCEGFVEADQIECWARLDKYLMEEVVPAVPVMWGVREIIVSGRVARYSYDPFSLTAALDQIALQPG